MLFGYAGRIGWINLSDGSVRVDELNEGTARKYLGGKGLGASILYDHLMPHTDPYAPENILIFASGPLTGTTFPAASRAAVITKSPMTGTFLDTYAGGYFGPHLKYAGFDVLVISGKAGRPVSVFADQGKITVRDGRALWGLSTSETEKRLREELAEAKNERISVASIGPAGENRVRFANIVTERRAFGRGGAGAVMGSKNLKAVALRGDTRVPIADKEGFKRIERQCRQHTAEHPMTGKKGVFPRIGTMMTVDLTQETGTLPTRNWQENTFEEAHAIDAGAFDKYIIRPRACYACPIGCSRDTRAVRNGVEIVTEGPEYETMYAFGSNCEIRNPEAIIEADRLCDDYGMDTISCGGVIGFAMECFERGLMPLEYVSDKDLSFGNEEAFIDLIHLIARREGIGEILCEGTKRASEKIEGSSDFAIHVKGLELPGYDPRGMKGQALTYALSDRGGCHMRSNTLRTELLGASEGVDRYAYENKAPMVRELQLRATTLDCLVACVFGSFAITLEDYAEALSKVTGWPVGPNELRRIAERTWTLTRLFNAREGFTRKHDSLPERLMKESSTAGPSKGEVVDKETFERMLDEYYDIAGWDRETGVPKEEKVKELGLKGLI